MDVHLVFYMLMDPSEEVAGGGGGGLREPQVVVWSRDEAAMVVGLLKEATGGGGLPEGSHYGCGFAGGTASDGGVARGYCEWWWVSSGMGA